MYNRFRKEKKGFTLVEIIVVLVILAILAAFTIPAMLGFVNNARKNSVLAEGHEVQLAFQSAFTEEYGGGFNDGGSTKYTDNRSGGDKNITYYLISNWSFNTENYNDKNSTNKTAQNWSDSSNRIAQKMLNYLNTDLTFYKTGNIDYNGEKLSKITEKKEQYRLMIIYTAAGYLKELYYCRNGYMYVLKDGVVSTYSSGDSAAKFPTYDYSTKSIT